MEDEEVKSRGFRGIGGRIEGVFVSGDSSVEGFAAMVLVG